MTPQELFGWTRRYERRHGRMPTVREAARRFRVRQEEIEAACDAGLDEAYLGLAVGGAVGGGYWTHDRLGDCEIEAYQEVTHVQR